MNIMGKKVILRAVEMSDAGLLKELQNSPRIEALCGSWSFPVSTQDQEGWINRLSNTHQTEIRLMIETISEQKTIGTVYLKDIDWKNRNAFVGIKTIDGSTRGRGFGFDALMALFRFAFKELGLHKLETLVIKDHPVSLDLCSNLGIEVEGIRRECSFSNGEYTDKFHMGILDREYFDCVKRTNYWEEEGDH